MTLSLEMAEPVWADVSGDELDEPQPDAWPDSDRLWVFRMASSATIAALTDSVELIDGTSVRPKASPFTMSLLHPDSLRRAAERAGKGDQLVSAKIAAELTPRLPDSTRMPIRSVTTRGLGQFGRFIGVEIAYPEFAEEQKAVRHTVNNLFGRHDWWDFMPHISLARGRLRNVPNLEEVERSLPATIDLSQVFVTTRRR